MKNYNYDPLVTGVFVGIGLLVIWYFSCLAIEEQILPNSYGFLSTLAATFIGAFLAFKFNSQRDEKNLRLEKIEVLYSLLHSYLSVAQEYLCSIKIESGRITRDNTLADKARGLIYKCELYKHMYFTELNLDPSFQYAELERLAGECDKYWSKVNEQDIQSKLDAFKLVADEVKKLNLLIEPLKKWCLVESKRLTNHQ